MRFWYQLKGIVLPPLQAVISPLLWFGSQFSGSSHSRSLVLGLPAMAAGVLCLFVLGLIALGSEEKYKSRYVTLAESAKKQADTTYAEIQQELQLVGGLTRPNMEKHAKWPQFLAERNQQRMYLEKLITLDRDLKHNFAYVMSFQEVLDHDQMRRMVEELAPESRAGYPEAHLYLANYYMAVSSPSPDMIRQFRNIAVIHADHVLQNMPDSVAAKEVKLRALMSLRRFSECLELAHEMFKLDPKNFEAIVFINFELGRHSENERILNEAATRLEEKIREHRQQDVEAWSTAIKFYANAMRLNQRYAEARQYLDQEMELFSESPARLMLLRDVKAELAIVWAESLNPHIAESTDVVNQALDLLAEGLTSFPRSPRALWLLTMIALREDATRERAISIYDPFSDSNPPALVLNQMGKHALLEKNFSSAIDFFERARQIDPRNPEMLNNLAYAYLTANIGSPETALSLVNEAISLIPRTRDADIWRSSFFHTRGVALLKLERYEEAAASFEVALEVRPDHPGILEGLVMSYEARGLQQAEIYRAKLEMVRKREEGSGQ